MCFDGLRSDDRRPGLGGLPGPGRSLRNTGIILRGADTRMGRAHKGVYARCGSGGLPMELPTFLAALALTSAAPQPARSQDVLKVAIPQRGAWDSGVAELGQRGGIFKKHGLNLEILYVQAGPESIQAVIGGSMDIATGAGVAAAVGTAAKREPILT